MSEGNKKPFVAKSHLQVAGVVAVLLLALLLLWYGNVNSYQSAPAIMAQVRFAGQYRIGDGPWEQIAEGIHIPATKGDVTLQGNFHMFAPDGSYVGIFRGDMPVAFYTDHIHLVFCEEGREPYAADVEDPLYGESACCETWIAHTFTSDSESPVEIRIHNPHRFGNNTAIDEMLSRLTFWSGIDFEKEVLKEGQTPRSAGFFFMVVSLVLLGIALFSTLIHIKNSKLLWLFGMVVMCAGTYFIYGARGISFWSDSQVSNTMLLGCAMVLYMLFLSMVIAYFLDHSRRLGNITVACLGAADALLFVLPMVTDLRFYDTWLYWAIGQSVANGILMGCLVTECCRAKKQTLWMYIGASLPLVAFCVDVVLTGLGVWKGGVLSKNVFVFLFVAAMVVVLRVIPRGINAAAKAKELETEKTALNAQLAQSRIATMMSQIRPHFIYNTLGSIEQLCELDPQKAGPLVHNFSKYLRGNFGELDNPRPIQMTQEMEHVQYYISIEKVRFPDMTFLFERNSVDFRLPALSVQPIVENAVKHGLMKRDKGGTIRVMTYETADSYCVCVEDDGVGFDPEPLWEDRAHMGLRNIRERLKAMVNGTLQIESTIGVGTKVLITIPKEEHP